MPDWGLASWEPDLAGRLKRPGGDTKLEVEYLFGRENIVGNPDAVSRYSGGVVGSDWCPVKPKPVGPRPRSSCICASSSSSISCCCSNFAISASKRRFWSTSFSYSIVFFWSCKHCQQLCTRGETETGHIGRNWLTTSLATPRSKCRPGRLRHKGVLPDALYTAAENQNLSAGSSTSSRQ